ncbi:MAG TPA: hypothetical protein VEA60_03500 [Allosphingosinicella sp.]|nr:hypothetical protein [Allosphingosinicella sp.]
MSDDEKKRKSEVKRYRNYFLAPHRRRDTAGNVVFPEVDAELLRKLEELDFKDREAVEKLLTDTTEKLLADAWQAVEDETCAATREMDDLSDGGNAATPTAPPIPPRAGEALVGLFCRREIREAVLGDLDEKFAELAERRGARIAGAWYWGQAARSALFFGLRWGRRLLELEAILKRIL